MTQRVAIVTGADGGIGSGIVARLRTDGFVVVAATEDRYDLADGAACRRLVADAISRLATDGGSILVAEQKTDLLAAISTRVAVLDGGRVAIAGQAESVLADERLPGLGVTEPSSVRLRRALAAAGIDERRVAAALADA